MARELDKAARTLVAIARQIGKNSQMAAPPRIKPPLEGPLNEREIFASEVVGVGSIHGNIAVQPNHIEWSPLGLMLTNVAAGEHLRNLQQLAAQIEAIANVAAGKQPH